MPSHRLRDEEVFDIIAPIVIYHRADLHYRKQAVRALRRGKAAARRGDSRLAFLQEHRDPDDIPAGGPQMDLYNQLFEDIVLGMRPDWQPARDSFGARGMKHGRTWVFTGDDAGFYPWCEDSAAIGALMVVHGGE